MSGYTQYVEYEEERNKTMLYITNLSSQENVDRPRGAMDSVSDFGSEGCEFKSRRGQFFF